MKNLITETTKKICLWKRQKNSKIVKLGREDASVVDYKPTHRALNLTRSCFLWVYFVWALESMIQLPNLFCLFGYKSHHTLEKIRLHKRKKGENKNLGFLFFFSSQIKKLPLYIFINNRRKSTLIHDPDEKFIIKCLPPIMQTDRKIISQLFELFKDEI